MNSLTNEEKDIILDFYFRCGSDERITAARDMIASDPRAADLYASLESTLCQLDHVKYEPCPDNLAAITVARLNLAASAERAYAATAASQESSLIEASRPSIPQERSRKWRTNISDMVAVAAVLLAVFSLAFPSLGKIRQVAWRNGCESRLNTVGAGMISYGNDNDGTLPYASTSAEQGSPWWKIGEQGPKNHSNTRHIWLLVKDDYVPAKNFVCPGRKDSRAVDTQKAQISKFMDFPSRQAISFSFIYMCDERAKRSHNPADVIMSDLNPVFESVFAQPAAYDKDDFGKIFVSDLLLEMMSTSHAGKGQNVLLRNGSISFIKERIVDGDDIFTIKDTEFYSGKEAPCDNDDIFLIP